MDRTYTLVIFDSEILDYLTSMNCPSLLQSVINTLPKYFGVNVCKLNNAS